MTSTQRFARGRAFTLIELLIVIGIIALLTAIAITVGKRLTSGGRARLTEDAIRVLNASIDEYRANKGAVPPPYVKDPTRSTLTRYAYVPIADCVNLNPPPGQDPLVKSLGWFLYQVAAPESDEAVTSVDAILQGLNPKLIRANLTFPTSASPGGPVEATRRDGVPARFRTVVDAWGRELRYVHPSLDGIIDPAEDTKALLGDPPAAPGASQPSIYSILKLRRSTKEKDADGGYCKSGDPYFYSAGPDGVGSTTDDNVYTNKPEFRRD